MPSVSTSERLNPTHASAKELWKIEDTNLGTAIDYLSLALRYPEELRLLPLEAAQGAADYYISADTHAGLASLLMQSRAQMAQLCFDKLLEVAYPQNHPNNPVHTGLMKHAQSQLTQLTGYGPRTTSINSELARQCYGLRIQDIVLGLADGEAIYNMVDKAADSDTPEVERQKILDRIIDRNSHYLGQSLAIGSSEFAQALVPVKPEYNDPDEIRRFINLATETLPPLESIVTGNPLHASGEYLVIDRTSNKVLVSVMRGKGRSGVYAVQQQYVVVTMYQQMHHGVVAVRTRVQGNSAGRVRDTLLDPDSHAYIRNRRLKFMGIAYENPNLSGDFIHINQYGLASHSLEPVPWLSDDIN